MADRVKFTAKVKRGLVLARGLLVDSFDPDATPSNRQVQKWRAKAQHDFNAAMAWLEQVEADQHDEPPQETFDMLAAAVGHRAENDPKAGGAEC